MVLELPVKLEQLWAGMLTHVYVWHTMSYLNVTRQRNLGCQRFLLGFLKSSIMSMVIFNINGYELTPVSSVHSPVTILPLTNLTFEISKIVFYIPSI